MIENRSEKWCDFFLECLQEQSILNDNINKITRSTSKVLVLEHNTGHQIHVAKIDQFGKNRIMIVFNNRAFFLDDKQLTFYKKDKGIFQKIDRVFYDRDKHAKKAIQEILELYSLPDIGQLFFSAFKDANDCVLGKKKPSDINIILNVEQNNHQEEICDNISNLYQNSNEHININGDQDIISKCSTNRSEKDVNVNNIGEAAQERLIQRQCPLLGFVCMCLSFEWIRTKFPYMCHEWQNGNCKILPNRCFERLHLTERSQIKSEINHVYDKYVKLEIDTRMARNELNDIYTRHKVYLDQP